MTSRRQFLLAAGTGLLAVRLGADAQPAGKVWRIGFLATIARPVSLESDGGYGQVPRSLKELGYIEGKNLVCEWRFAEGRYELLPDLAAELIRLRVDAIVTDGTPGIRAAQAATTTIPIVFLGGADVVASGFVKSLSRPGGNTTGVSILLSDTLGKQLELLTAVVPGISKLAVLSNPDNDAHPALVRTLRDVALKSRIQVTSFLTRTPDEITNSIAAASEAGCQALIYIVDSFFTAQRFRIAEQSLRHRLPSMSGYPLYAESGGLLCYGPNRTEGFRTVARLLDKIFRGANPGDLPVEQPTKLELVVNRKTAKALGITIPPEVLLLADKVIE